MSLRVGVGYDSHRLVDGRPLILGGVEIPHDRGLDGHSDADVLSHAITDAILGAAGEGDIGRHFPPDDERWRDADSIELLRQILAKVGCSVVNVDATVICEQPKLGPHIAAIAERLTEAVGAPVSVKATTNEGMGAIGRGEGIAVTAVALIELIEGAQSLEAREQLADVVGAVRSEGGVAARSGAAFGELLEDRRRER